MKDKSSQNNPKHENCHRTESAALPELRAVERDGAGEHGQASGLSHVDEDQVIYVYKLQSSRPNLVKEHDEFLNIDTGQIDVILKKCSCKCVWCVICWLHFYCPKIKAFMEAMDRKRVRHITLTIARDQFITLEEAYRLFNAGEFVSRLTRGKRKRDGIKWADEYIFKPIEWHLYLWWVEFHEDGTAHWHLVLEVDQEGQQGMIGGDRLRHYWPYGRINEAYFETEEHWKHFTGYEAKTGYASKDKANQGLLPELLDQAGSKKLRRWGHSREKEEVEKTATEVFQDLGRYFTRKGVKRKQAENNQEEERQANMKRAKKRSYSVIMQSCGKQTFAKFMIGKWLYKVLLEIPYKETTKAIEGKYVEKKGYVATITMDQYKELMNHCIRVISCERMNHSGVKDYIKRRSAAIDKMAVVIGDKWMPKNRRPFTW